MWELVEPVVFRRASHLHGGVWDRRARSRSGRGSGLRGGRGGAWAGAARAEGPPKHKLERAPNLDGAIGGRSRKEGCTPASWASAWGPGAGRGKGRKGSSARGERWRGESLAGAAIRWYRDPGNRRWRTGSAEIWGRVGGKAPTCAADLPLPQRTRAALFSV